MNSSSSRPVLAMSAFALTGLTALPLVAQEATKPPSLGPARLISKPIHRPDFQDRVWLLDSRNLLSKTVPGDKTVFKRMTDECSPNHGGPCPTRRYSTEQFSGESPPPRPTTYGFVTGSETLNIGLLMEFQVGGDMTSYFIGMFKKGSVMPYCAIPLSIRDQGSSALVYGRLSIVGVFATDDSDIVIRLKAGGGDATYAWDIQGYVTMGPDCSVRHQAFQLHQSHGDGVGCKVRYPKFDKLVRVWNNGTVTMPAVHKHPCYDMKVTPKAPIAIGTPFQPGN
jgi:hypothetical protein